MAIDPKVERPTRTMLGHAIRSELGELADVILAIGDENLAASIPLCVSASAYIAIDVSRFRRPHAGSAEDDESFGLLSSLVRRASDEIRDER